MVQRTPQREKDLALVAERALRASQMDSIGLYLFDENRNPTEGVIIGMPDAFSRAYETTGMRIDPVLHHLRDTGAPCSTVTRLGDGILHIFEILFAHHAVGPFGQQPLSVRIQEALPLMCSANVIYIVVGCEGGVNRGALQPAAELRAGAVPLAAAGALRAMSAA